jgi:EmrB/QacA subfamily drug resistance transporter
LWRPHADFLAFITSAFPEATYRRDHLSKSIDGLRRRPQTAEPITPRAVPEDDFKPEPVEEEPLPVPARPGDVVQPERQHIEQAPETQKPALEHDEHRERSHGEIMVIMGALMLALLLAALDQTIVATALPKIAQDLNGLSKLSWVATAYLLTSAVVTPLYGKISDMFGRKKLFMVAITIFLIGSALCGLSQNMDQLIFFRGLQGIGGGGLMTMILTIVGDVVPPRQRGRYQGYFGAVFGISSVVGPLLGGYLTDNLSWRWIFYVNIPLGIVALLVVAARLHLVVRKSPHRIDFAGALVLAASTVALLLGTVWGGNQYPWGSTTIIGLLGGGALGILLFILIESKAAEPIIPLRLFKNDIFRVSTLLSLISGMVMFATIIYLPEYQQIVRGYSATKSGLLLLPLVLGLLVAVTTSGRLISKMGRYRMFPIIGTIILAVGLYLLSHVGVDTSQLELSGWMLVAGAGIGMFLQVMTLAVQNSVSRADLGSATSTVIFFRNMGSSFGTAIFGSILISRLTFHLRQLLPSSPITNSINGNNLQAGAAQLAKLPPAIRGDILEAFARSFHDIFLWGIPLALLAFVVALFLREQPLRASITQEAEGVGLEG